MSAAATGAQLMIGAASTIAKLSAAAAANANPTAASTYNVPLMRSVQVIMLV